MTTGGTGIGSTTTGGGYWINGEWYPYGYPQPTSQVSYGLYWWPYPSDTEPQSCIGKAHVFECEHVTACKCGAIKRVMPKTKKSR